MEAFKEFEQLQQLLSGAASDAKQFAEKGNKAAGVRLRKAMQAVKGQAQLVREVVLKQSN